MPEDNSTQFNEMLRVGVDITSFQEGLRQLEDVYTQFLQRINAAGGSGSDVVQIGALGALSEQIAELQRNFVSLQQGVAETLTSITGGLVETIEGFEKTIEEKFVLSSKARVNQSKIEADSRIEDARKVAKALADAQRLDNMKMASGDGRADIRNSGSMLGTFDKTFQDPQVKALSDAELKQAAKGVADRLELELNAQKAIIDAKRKEVEEAAVIQRQEEIQTANYINRVNAAWDKALLEDQTRSKKRLLTAEEEIKLRQEIDARYIQNYNANWDKAILENEKITQKAIEAKAKEVRAKEELDAKYNADYIRMLNEAYRIKQELDAKKLAAQNAPSRLDKFLGQSKEDILAMTLGLGEFLVAMAALQAIMDVVTAPFRMIADSIKSGWEYLTKLQATAADLQGVIAANVKFTGDMAENYRLSGEAATEVVKQLQLIATQTGVGVEQLTSAFKAVIDGGGAAFTQNMGDNVKLAELFAVAVKATGKDFQVQRTLISEIPGLLNGSISANSKILETLHMSKEEWEKMRSSALEHGNLIEQLEPKMAPFLTVIQQADMRMAALNEKLDLMKNQISASILQPIWEAWLGILQKAGQYLLDHKEQLISIGSLVVDVLKNFVDLVSNWLKITGLGEALREILSAVLSVAVILGGVLSIIIESTTFVLNAFRGIIDMWADPTSWFKKDAWSKLFDDLANEAEKAKKKMEDSAVKTADSLDGSGKSDKSNVLNLKTTGKKPPGGDNEAQLKELKDEYQKRLKVINEFYDAMLAIQKRALDAGKISEEEYFQKAEMFLQSKKAAAEKLATEIEGKTGSGKKAKAVDNQIDEKTISEVARVNAAIDRIEDERVKKDATLRKMDFQERLKMGQDILRHEIELAKLIGGTHQDLANKEAALHELEYEDRKATLEKQRALEQREVELQKIDSQIAANEANHNTQTQIDEIKKHRAAVDDLIEANKLKSTQDHEDFDRMVIAEEAHNRQDKSLKSIAESNLKLAKAQLAVVDADIKRLEDEQALAILYDEDAKKIDAITEALQRLKAERDKQADTVQKAQDSEDGTTAKGDAIESIFRNGARDIKDVFQDGFANGVAGLMNAFTFFKGLISNLIGAFKQGQAQGGVLGGIGAVASQVGGQIGQFFPVAGAIISGAGQIMSLIGGIFTAAARKIAEEMKKSFDQIVKNYQNGTTNLIDTINQLEQKRLEAIQRLSGKKGGKDELNKLLPAFDDEIASLKKQAADLITSFNLTTEKLALGSDELSNFLQLWTDINKQVKDYIGAGGSLQTANEFLMLKLKEFKDSAMSSLNEGESQAIQDALQLNDLLKQRVDLIKQYNATVFGLMNADSIERQEAGAIVRASQLADAKEQFDKQLSDLDAQINLTTIKVNKEREVFDLATSIDELHKRDNELQLLALNEQIKKWNELKEVVKGITINPDGSFNILGQLLSILGSAAGVGTGTGGSGGVGGSGGGFGGGGNGGRDFVGPTGSGGLFGDTGGSTGPIFPNGEFPEFHSANRGGHSTSVSNTIQVTVSTTGGVDGQQLANTISDELYRASRAGFAPIVRRN